MKRSNSIFSIICALVFSLSACNAPNGNSGEPHNPISSHEHTFSSAWNSDSTYHWHDATCGHDVVDSKATHTFNDVVTSPTYSAGGYTTHICTVCGYSYTDNETSQLIHNYSQNWTSDSSTHWHACTDSGYEHLKQDEATHTFNDVVTSPTYSAGGYTTHICTVCGYSYTDNETSQLTYTITWLNWDGSLLSKDYYYEGEYPSYAGTPTKEKDDDFSYSFSGWYPSIVPVDSNATYTAQFSSSTRQYLVHYNAHGGVGAPEDQTKTKNEDLILSSKTPTREHYTFCGWNCFSSSKVYQPKGIFDIDEDITLYAMWREHCHTCDGHGTVEYQETCSKCSGKGTITTSTRHWVNCSSCNGKGTVTTSYTGACSSCNGLGGRYLCTCSSGHNWWWNDGSKVCPYCGKTAYKTEKITTCSTCGGKGSVKTSKTSTCSSCNGSGGRYTTSTSTSTCSTCQGLGKLTKSKTCGFCNGEKYLYPQTPVLESVTHRTIVLKAINGFEYSNGGSVWQSSNVFENLKAKTTYVFYQRKAADLSTPFGISSKELRVTTSSITTYPITYVLNGGANDPSNPSSYTVESPTITFSAPTKAGYTFLGWFDNNGNQVTSIAAGTTGALTLTARWNEGNGYTVTLDANGGRVSETSVDVQYDHAYSLPDAARSGYTFLGWYDGSAKVNGEGTWRYTTDKTLVAHWSIIDYSINYVLNGGANDPSNPSSYTVESPTITFSAPTKAGYTFLGWFDNNGNQVTSVAAGTTGDLALNARWEANMNGLSVTSEDTSKGTASITSGNGYSGESITVVAIPIGDNVFRGWYDGDGGFVSSSNQYTFTMPANDYSLVARFLTKAEAEEERAIRYGTRPILSEDGKTITYGLYPQTNVNDSTLVSALNSLTTPESNGWYLYNNDYYAKVSATPNDSSYKFDNGTAIVNGTTYWFRCEPIRWNILNSFDGTCYVQSQMVLACGVWDDDSLNYKDSILRSWLNNVFYQNAFGLDSKNIMATEVDNSKSSTCLDTGCECENTFDYVTCLSAADFSNADFGFSTDWDYFDSSRAAMPTDYALAIGCHMSTSKDDFGYAEYWTRSPNDVSLNPTVIRSNGSIGYGYLKRAWRGIRPAVKIKF